MPAMHYRVRWPDATESDCYSPSLVIEDYLTVGAEYSPDEFLKRVRAATAIANDRVREKFGFACSRASDQLIDTEARMARYAGAVEQRVRVLAFERA